MDDTYTVLRKDQAQKFTDYLNTVDEDIKWTTEGEVVKDIEGLENRTERGLAFLDTFSDKRRRDDKDTRLQEGHSYRSVPQFRE